MTPQTNALQWGLVVWLAIFAGMFAYRLLTGEIAIRGLLTDRFSGIVMPDRLQMLVVTLAAAATYASLAIEAKGFPEVPEWALAVFGGSQGIYLFGKGLRGQ